MQLSVKAVAAGWYIRRLPPVHCPPLTHDALALPLQPDWTAATVDRSSSSSSSKTWNRAHPNPPTTTGLTPVYSSSSGGSSRLPGMFCPGPQHKCGCYVLEFAEQWHRESCICLCGIRGVFAITSISVGEWMGWSLLLPSLPTVGIWATLPTQTDFSVDQQCWSQPCLYNTDYHVPNTLWNTNADYEAVICATQYDKKSMDMQ